VVCFGTGELSETSEVSEMGVKTRTQQGYKYLIVWEKLVEIRKLVYDINRRFPKSEHRRVSQMNDAARSAKQNVQEGYFRSTAEFIRALTISQGSLGELVGDLEDCLEDGLISREEFDHLNELCNKTLYLLGKLIDSLRKKL
jgi:four helix bundle protein